jgi:hypothetical protein
MARKAPLPTACKRAGGLFISEGELMPGRGPQTFKKRQKEQQRRERQQEKMAKRLARKEERPTSPSEDQNPAEAETQGEQPAAANPPSGYTQ